MIRFSIAKLAAVALSVAPAEAATSTVKLHTDADTTKFLSDTGSGVTSMVKSPDGALQRPDRDEVATHPA